MLDGSQASTRRRTPRRAPTAEVREDERRTTDGDGAPPLVLLVDDVEDNRELYASYFEYSGYRVEQAADGEEALSKIAREAPALVVMDLSMPRLDGWEATRIIKSNPRTKRIVVLVLTGFASPVDLSRARAAGADDICTKPCLPKELLERVEKLLDGRAR